jgi:hypothetical protein
MTSGKGVNLFLTGHKLKTPASSQSSSLPRRSDANRPTKKLAEPRGPMLYIDWQFFLSVFFYWWYHMISQLLFSQIDWCYLMLLKCFTFWSLMSTIFNDSMYTNAINWYTLKVFYWTEVKAKCRQYFLCEFATFKFCSKAEMCTTLKHYLLAGLEPCSS